MKGVLKTLPIFLLAFLMMGCPEMKPDIIFEKPVPGLKVNLSKKIGDSFQIVSDEDTIDYRLIFQKEGKINYLIADENDTMFVGTVTKRNEMFLLNHQYEDGTYRIHAIKFSDSTITGLGQSWAQASVIRTEIDNGNYAELVVDSASEITLKATIRKGKQMFRTALDHLEPKTLLRSDINLDDFDTSNEPGPTTTVDVVPEKLSMSMVAKVYPNPVIDMIHVELGSNDSKTIRVINQNGQVLKIDKTNQINVQMDLSDLKTGIYILEVSNEQTGVKETKKIVKN